MKGGGSDAAAVILIGPAVRNVTRVASALAIFVRKVAMGFARATQAMARKRATTAAMRTFGQSHVTTSARAKHAL